jgi:hypothetical protein
VIAAIGELQHPDTAVHTGLRDVLNGRDIAIVKNRHDASFLYGIQCLKSTVLCQRGVSLSGVEMYQADKQFNHGSGFRRPAGVSFYIATVSPLQNR